MGLSQLNSTKLGLICLAQGHNTVTPMRLEPTAPQSLVKHSTTEPLPSLVGKGLKLDRMKTFYTLYLKF